MHTRQDGIISFKYKFNDMFKSFNDNIQKFEKIFQIQIMLENIKLLQVGKIQNQEKLFQQFADIRVTNQTIKTHYEALFNHDKKMIKYPQEIIDQSHSKLLWIKSQYLNILNMRDIQILELKQKMLQLKDLYKAHFLFQSTEIYYQCRELLNLKQIQYQQSFEYMVQLIINIHQKPVEMILSINFNQFKNTRMIENFELLSQSINTFTLIYSCKYSFNEIDYIQLSILLQYLERLLELDFKEHQSNELQKFEFMVNVRNQGTISDQALNKYSLKLIEQVKKKLVADKKITQKIRFQIRKIFQSQLVLDIMKDIQQSLNIPIDLSWSFLPSVSLVIIPECNFKGCTLRNNGISINLTPFLNLYRYGFTNGYKEILCAYCILVAINGWNCQQLIKKTQKSFHWYDDHIQYLNIEEFTFFKNLFGITRMDGNRQLFSLQYLNQDTAKLIISIGEQQYTKDKLHHLFKFYPNIQYNQPSLQLFHETIEEQLQLDLKLD